MGTLLLLFYLLTSVESGILKPANNGTQTKNDGLGTGSSASSYNNNAGFGPNVADCDDIAIIGAGIAGAYTAWRLRETNQSIAVYEYSNRIGGRLYTDGVPGGNGFKAELGGMRFSDKLHQLLNKTIHDLGLTIIDFELGLGATDNTLMYLRGVRMRHKDLGNNRTPYTLRPEEIKPIYQLLWEIVENNTDLITNNKTSLFDAKTNDGIPLYRQSAQSVLTKSISEELQHYIQDVGGFHLFGTISAVSALPKTDPSSFANFTIIMKTVKEGMNEIPKKLLNVFNQQSARHSIHLNHHLRAITTQSDGYYRLHFDINKNSAVKTTCAKKVILAINRLALENLDWPGMKQYQIRGLITKSVKDIPAAKLFLAYDHPWWRSSDMYDRFAMSDTPLQRSYDFGTMKVSNISILNAVYADTDVSLWKELVERGSSTTDNTVFTITPEIVSITHKYLASIFNISLKDIPNPLGGIVSVWDSYPFGGGWNEWLPGYIYDEVENKMIKPLDHQEIYTVCNAFNSRSKSHWSESALEAAELVLKYFNV